MKHSILCYLLGHYWRRYEAGYYYPHDWCRRCGLSKEEVGIKTEKSEDKS